MSILCTVMNIIKIVIHLCHITFKESISFELFVKKQRVSYLNLTEYYSLVDLINSHSKNVGASEVYRTLINTVIYNRHTVADSFNGIIDRHRTAG